MSPRMLWSWAALTLIAAVAALALVHAPAAAAPAAPQLAQTEIVVTPRKEVYAVGDVVTVTVQINNLEDFAGGDLKWPFDASSFQVIDANPDVDGVQVQAGSLFASDSAVALNAVDNSTGSLQFVAVRFGLQGYHGDGSLVTIRFRVVAGCGATQFELHPGEDDDPSRLRLSNTVPSSIAYQEAIPFTIHTPACPNHLFLPLVSRARG